MQRVAATGDGIELQETCDPALADGSVLIRTGCSLISPGTELHYLDQCRQSDAVVPLGYCAAGTVIKTGAGVRGLAIGDRVVAMGWGEALHAEVIAVSQRLCHRLPAALPFSSGVFAALACTAFHALNRAATPAGYAALVVGGGLVGQLLACAARWRGLRIAVVDHISERTGLVPNDFCVMPEDERWATHPGTNLDAVFLCASGVQPRIVERAASSLRQEPNGRPIGRIVIVGRFTTDTAYSVELGNVDIVNVAHAGYGYRNWAYTQAAIDLAPPPGQKTVDTNLAEAVEMLAANAPLVSALHTHRFPFEEAKSAYRLLTEHRQMALGVTLEFSRDRT